MKKNFFIACLFLFTFCNNVFADVGVFLSDLVEIRNLVTTAIAENPPRAAAAMRGLELSKLVVNPPGVDSEFLRLSTSALRGIQPGDQQFAALMTSPMHPAEVVAIGERLGLGRKLDPIVMTIVMGTFDGSHQLKGLLYRFQQAQLFPKRSTDGFFYERPHGNLLPIEQLALHLLLRESTAYVVSRKTFEALGRFDEVQVNGSTAQRVAVVRSNATVLGTRKLWNLLRPEIQTRLKYLIVPFGKDPQEFQRLDIQMEQLQKTLDISDLEERRQAIGVVVTSLRLMLGLFFQVPHDGGSTAQFKVGPNIPRLLMSKEHLIKIAYVINELVGIGMDAGFYPKSEGTTGCPPQLRFQNAINHRLAGLVAIARYIEMAFK